MTKKIALFVALALTSLAAIRFATQNEIAQWPGTTVVQVQSPDGRPCTFFRLNGIDKATSNARVSPWFSVNMNKNGYKEMVSMLLMALASGKSVSVTTTGGIDNACGEAEVSRVFVQ